MSDVEPPEFINTRHRDAAIQLQKKEKVSYRLGRRESEPHSFKINYIHDVLTVNFPQDRVCWDLHHYFLLGNSKVDLQFDISYFRNFDFKDQLSSFNQEDHEMRKPDMVINILSKSTYHNDLGINAQNCIKLGIPVYVAFSDHLPNPEVVKAPLLKVFYRDKDRYVLETLVEYCCIEGKNEIDITKTIDIAQNILPFKLGIMKLNAKYWLKGKRYDLYQLIFIDRKTGERLKTKAEKEKERAEKERIRAEKEKERAEKERIRAEKEKERAEKAEKKLEELEKRLIELEKKSKK